MNELVYKAKSKFSYRKLIYWILVLTFFYFVSKYLTEIEQVLEALLQGRLEFILIAMLFEVLFYLYSTQFSIKLLRVNQIRVPYIKMLKFFTTSAFLNVSAPGGSLGGLIYQIKKVSVEASAVTGKVFISLVMQVLNLYWSFMLLAFVSMWFVISHGMQYATMFTAVMLFALISGVTFGVYVLLREYPSKLLSWVNRFNVLHKWLKRLIKKYNGEGTDLWIEKKIVEIHDATRKISETKGLWGEMLISGMMLHLIHATILYYVMSAFNIPFSPSLLVVGYTTMYLFTVISPTPLGIGVAEGFAQLVFVAFGVESEKALLAVLAFRAITVWIPMIIGFATFRFGERKSDASDNVRS